MREDLKARLPQATIDLKSNVEFEVPHVDTTRLGTTRLRFHDHKSGKKGVILPLWYDSNRIQLTLRLEGEDSESEEDS